MWGKNVKHLPSHTLSTFNHFLLYSIAKFIFIYNFTTYTNYRQMSWNIIPGNRQQCKYELSLTKKKIPWQFIIVSQYQYSMYNVDRNIFFLEWSFNKYHWLTPLYFSHFKFIWISLALISLRLWVTMHLRGLLNLAKTVRSHRAGTGLLTC